MKLGEIIKEYAEEHSISSFINDSGLSKAYVYMLINNKNNTSIFAPFLSFFFNSFIFSSIIILLGLSHTECQCVDVCFSRLYRLDAGLVFPNMICIHPV